MEKPFQRGGGYNRAAQKIMWVGVALFSLSIIILWGWAFKLQLSLIHLTKTPESALVKNAKIDWDQAFAENKKEINQTEVVKQQVQSALNTIIMNAAVTTTNSQTNSSTISTQQP